VLYLFLEFIDTHLCFSDLFGKTRWRLMAYPDILLLHVIGNLVQDVAAVTDSTAAAASVSLLNRNVDNVAVIGSEIQTSDRNVRISLLDPSSNGRRRNGVSRQISNEPTRRSR